MSQKGFATIFGLCLILAVALCAKSIQETETNYSYAAADYQSEFELQNAAIGGIYEAAELVRSGDKILKANDNPTLGNRKQIELINRPIERADDNHRLKKIHLRVWGERLDGNIQSIMLYSRKYPKRNLAARGEKGGYILFSVAESFNGRTSGKIYRKAFAYVVSEDLGGGTYKDEPTIYFMEPKE